ncbi:MAG: outer membrane protein assembly factor BamC [Janthinobacterium lividum]
MLGAAIMASLLGACSSGDPQGFDYLTTRKSRAPSLANPPDLVDEAPSERVLPPVNGAASLSAYQRAASVAPTIAPADKVLPTSPDLYVQRDGQQRWLVVKNASRDELWAKLHKFWQEQGYLLVVDSHERFIMETDWKESHANLDQGIVRNTLTRAMDNMYVTGERNRYRTRLETGADGSTYVFISQRGMSEVLTGTNNESSKWVERPNDPNLEAQYLSRFMAVLADDNARLAAQNAYQNGAPTPTAAPSTSAPQAPAAAQALAQPNAAHEQDVATTITPDSIELAESYDHAWLRVGLALERGNFTVNDRDRNLGIYTISYVDPNDLGTAGQGFWNQLFHGKKEKTAIEYRVNVKAQTETSTRVAVVNTDGVVISSPQATRIMSLLAAQLR